MRRTIKDLLSFILYIWYRVFNKLPVISSIYFHDPSPEVFERVLKWYQNHGYRIISLAELTDVMGSGVEPKERLAFISLDDGWRSNLKLIPICEKYNAPITIFVATEPLCSGNFWWEYATKKLGRNGMLKMKKLSEPVFYSKLETVKDGSQLERSALTVDELSAISKNPLVTIQSHTVNHPILTNLTDSSLLKELKDSKCELEGLLGYPVEVFSYPNGDVSQREINSLKALGYKYAFTTKGDIFDIRTNDPYLLPRMALNTKGGKYENLAKLTGVWFRLFQEI